MSSSPKLSQWSGREVTLRKPSSWHNRLLSLAGIILAHVPDGIPALLLSIPGLTIKLCSTLVCNTAVPPTNESRESLRSRKLSVCSLVQSLLDCPVWGTNQYEQQQTHIVAVEAQNSASVFSFWPCDLKANLEPVKIHWTSQNSGPKMIIFYNV